MSAHAEDCEGEWVELHRIDPEQSRPPVGTVTTESDGSVTFVPKKDRAGAPLFGRKKYDKKVIVFYCPSCGHKKEEPWK